VAPTTQETQVTIKVAAGAVRTTNLLAVRFLVEPQCGVVEVAVEQTQGLAGVTGLAVQVLMAVQAARVDISLLRLQVPFPAGVVEAVFPISLVARAAQDE
jgi:hypothetical protein